MPWIPSDSYCGRDAEIYYNGALQPNPAKFYGILAYSTSYATARNNTNTANAALAANPTDPTAIANANTANAALTTALVNIAANDIATIVKLESTVAGYARQQYNPAEGSFNTTKRRYEMPGTTLVFAAPNPPPAGTINFNLIAKLSDASATASKTFTADETTNRLTVTAHGLTNGDRVVPTGDGGATLPAGMTAQAYYAKNIDANTVELYTTSALSAIVDFTNAGTGTLRLRYAQGNFDLFEVYEDSSINGSTDSSNPNTQNVQIFLTRAGAGVDVSSP